MSDIVGQHFGAIIAAVYAAVVGWSIYSKNRAQARAGAGSCARCGSSGASIGAPAGEGVLCPSCATERRRHDRLATSVWVGLIALAAIMLVIEVRDAIQLHRALRWESAGGLVVVSIGGVLIIWRYRMRRGSETTTTADGRASRRTTR